MAFRSILEFFKPVKDSSNTDFSSRLRSDQATAANFMEKKSRKLSNGSKQWNYAFVSAENKAEIVKLLSTHLSMGLLLHQ